jgi:heparanase
MRVSKFVAIFAVGALAMLKATAAFEIPSGTTFASLLPRDMPRMGTVDDRFQSFNIEMLEVTGGDFWKPYSKSSDTAPPPGQSNASVPVGMNPSMYQYRPPIDLANPRLRKLAAALGPAYVRVSGTWANTTYFQDADDPSPKAPPAGFHGVLTRQEWKGVVDFSHAVNAQIVTSFATGAGTRDNGVWTPQEATKFIAYTRSIGGNIAAAEFMNEPTAAAMGGAPKGYDGAAYGRDLAVFVPFIRKMAPDMLILGPGSVGEGGVFPMPAGISFLKSEDLLQATGPVFDVFSYHFYGAVSKRCASMGSAATTTADAALSDEWLSRTGKVEAFYAGLRDKFEPGKPLWITETADAACGGNPWASTFLDSFRYLNQLGTMAQRGVQVVAHNTLDASDYGLLDETTYAPRPNYWAALLWRRLMGTTVLNPGNVSAQGLHVYAHCLRGHPGGVVILVINANRTAPESLKIPESSERYALTAAKLMDTTVLLNGLDLKLGADDALPKLTGASTPAGDLTFAPASITFLAVPNANNASCVISHN